MYPFEHLQLLFSLFLSILLVVLFVIPWGFPWIHGRNQFRIYFTVLSVFNYKNTNRDPLSVFMYYNKK